MPVNTDNTADINWKFIPFSANDADLFTANNPLTAIFLIEAGASRFLTKLSADEGAIMVSDYTSNDWTISTIQTPDTETQPFSGNRQWGWLINQNGNLELFTRAVDVAIISDLILIYRSNPFSDIDEECQQNDYYNVAEATWKNMQQEISEWINDDEISNGGQASINPPKALRVKKQTIIEILTSTESINQILSNCN
ncbi:hypothetical protein F6U93_01525 [Tamlana haliotis]|uniref:Uncharacterized protein n=1 Tax=Pseudotamlana haliotis TaxID=2614804 RepID=A0A6N6MLY3_9FLAO|nr:hypothetical protein [Tamlana haliotis]KAB1071096.1 hypothetical protein F6U93_01525 [Tamlana haliotis]